MDPHPIPDWNFIAVIQFLWPKMFYALICGGLVGLERELKNKAAGIKTNMLICAGSALFTSMSVLIANAFSEQYFYGDPGRLAAQIVSGIGFLGGGAIIQSRGSIVGLTTAATIWVVAAIGVMIGLGHGEAAVAVSAVVVGMLVLVTYLESRYLGRSHVFSCELLIDDASSHFRKTLQTSLEHNDLSLDDFDMASKGALSVIRLRYRGHRSDHRKFILELWNLPGIREVKQQ